MLHLYTMAKSIAFNKNEKGMENRFCSMFWI